MARDVKDWLWQLGELEKNCSSGLPEDRWILFGIDKGGREGSARGCNFSEGSFRFGKLISMGVTTCHCITDEQGDHYIDLGSTSQRMKISAEFELSLQEGGNERDWSANGRWSEALYAKDLTATRGDGESRKVYEMFARLEELCRDAPQAIRSLVGVWPVVGGWSLVLLAMAIQRSHLMFDWSCSIPSVGLPPWRQKTKGRTKNQAVGLFAGFHNQD